MIVRVFLAQPHHPRSTGAYVVDEAEARELAALGVLEPRLELVVPQDGASEADAQALAAELFPAVVDPDTEDTSPGRVVVAAPITEES